MFLKGVYVSKLKTYTSFFHIIKLSGHRMGIKFDRDPLALEQNNYVNKIKNAYHAYDADTWPKNPLWNGITYYGAGSSNFGSNFAKNDVIFGVDNSSSPHADNRKHKFLVVGEGSTYGINGKFVPLRKSLALLLVKQTHKFTCVCIIMVIIVICLLRKK